MASLSGILGTPQTVQLDALPGVADGAVPLGVRVALAALVGAIFWNYLTWFFGLPSSSSHALIGGLIGAGISAGGLSVIAWDSVKLVIVAIFASPLVAFTIAILAMWLVRGIQRVFNVHEDSEFFRWAQVGSSAFVSWGHGANDAQKTMGVVAATLYSGGFLAASNANSLEPPYWVILAAHAAIAAGTVWGGWKIIETMGLKITRITRASGFAANIGAVTSIEGATHLGIPISTTQAVSSSIIGSGVGARRRVNWLVLRDMFVAWLLTMPAAALISYVVFQFTVLPSVAAIALTSLSIIALLAWATRLMLHAETAADIERELPTDEELRTGTGYGIHVSQPDEPAVPDAAESGTPLQSKVK